MVGLTCFLVPHKEDGRGAESPAGMCIVSLQQCAQLTLERAGEVVARGSCRSFECYFFNSQFCAQKVIVY